MLNSPHFNSLTKANEYAQHLARRVANAKEKTEEALGQGLQLVEVAGASFLAGYANTKFGASGELTVKNVPVDLLAGIGLKALSLLGAAGKYGEHAGNIGDGFVAAYTYRAGVHMASAAA